MSHLKLALNASTLFPFHLDAMAQIRVASEAGYEGIELWVKDIEAYLENGGSIKELKAFVDECGISVVNAITFFKWSDEDEEVRRDGLRQAEREMTMLAELGCQAVAAPPSGNVENVSLTAMASHFSELTRMARKIGIEPYLEFWGRAKRLSTLSEALFVAMESGFPDIKILIDPFHMYTGGSSLEGLSYLNGKHIGIVHVNDYPTAPPRAVISDADRVFPGEGVLPTEKLTAYLGQSGYSGYLSLELFIESYGNQTPLEVAEKGLETIKKAYQLERLNV